MFMSQGDRTGKPLYLLYPGDHYASRDDCFIGTVAGSCLVVCLLDITLKLGGMINFVVPGTIGTQGILHDDISRIGIVNMEYLMADMVKLGGDRKRMIAKIFGAGNTENSSLGQISLPENNIRFVKEYFELERIRIEKMDIGGMFRRKLYFSPRDGTVYRKILKKNDENSEFVALEREYVNNEFVNRNRVGKIVLFD
ncbi:MAG TPA: chemotaxis protein CheD [Spirochaetota bacterium]|nr:chemotaxis protein CheD [Spirochaetota bacterium]